MPTFHVQPQDIPGILESHAVLVPAAVRAGSLKAAHRARATLVRVSPVDTGQFKNSWRVIESTGTTLGIRVDNDAPHAGIIELGARPHKVNREGIEALTLWAKRNIVFKQLAAAKKSNATIQDTWAGKRERALAVDAVEKQARAIAFAIAKKIEKHGQKGLYLVQNRMGDFTKWTAQEVSREVAKALGANPPRGRTR